MLSPYMRNKYVHYFGLWDHDGDYVIGLEDFVQLLERMAKLTNLPEDSQQYKLLYEATVELWTGIQQFADTNNDNHITLEEWLVYSEALLPLLKPMAEANIPTPMGDYIFRFMDKNGDGVIEVDTWRAFTYAWGIQDIPEEHFDWLDTNQDGKITYAEFSSLLYVWALSEDSTETGNLLFGRFNLI